MSRKYDIALNFFVLGISDKQSQKTSKISQNRYQICVELSKQIDISLTARLWRLSKCVHNMHEVTFLCVEKCRNFIQDLLTLYLKKLEYFQVVKYVYFYKEDLSLGRYYKYSFDHGLIMSDRILLELTAETLRLCDSTRLSAAQRHLLVATQTFAMQNSPF